jgi:hypothetical protein
MTSFLPGSHSCAPPQGEIPRQLRYSSRSTLHVVVTREFTANETVELPTRLLLETARVRVSHACASNTPERPA